MFTYSIYWDGDYLEACVSNGVKEFFNCGNDAAKLEKWAQAKCDKLNSKPIEDLMPSCEEYPYLNNIF